jgi:hypothetical protein
MRRGENPRDESSRPLVRPAGMVGDGDKGHEAVHRGSDLEEKQGAGRETGGERHVEDDGERLEGAEGAWVQGGTACSQGGGGSAQEPGGGGGEQKEGGGGGGGKVEDEVGTEMRGGLGSGRDSKAAPEFDQRRSDLVFDYSNPALYRWSSCLELPRAARSASSGRGWPGGFGGGGAPEEGSPAHRRMLEAGIMQQVFIYKLSTGDPDPGTVICQPPNLKP